MKANKKNQKQQRRAVSGAIKQRSAGLKNAQTQSKGLSRSVRVDRGRSDFSMTDTTHKRYGNGVRIRGTDWVGDIQIGTAAAQGDPLIDIVVRPDAFPGTRLSQLAPLWERYSVRSWKFCYFPAVSAIEPGQFLGYPEYDPLDPLAATATARIREGFAAMDSVVWNVYDDSCIEFAKVDPYTDLFTDYRQDDPRLSSIGKLRVLANSALNPSTLPKSYGTLMMQFEIDFWIPQVGSVSVESPNVTNVSLFTPRVSDLPGLFATSDQPTTFLQPGTTVPMVELSSNAGALINLNEWLPGDILTAVVSNVPALVGGSIVWNDEASQPSIKLFDTIFLKILNNSNVGGTRDSDGGTFPYATRPGQGGKSPWAAVFGSLESALHGEGGLESLMVRLSDNVIGTTSGTGAAMESNSEIDWSSGATSLPWLTNIASLIITSVIPRRRIA